MDGFYMIFLIPAMILLIMGLIFLFVVRKVTKPEKHWPITTGTIIQKEKNMTLSIGNFINKGKFVSTLPDSAPTFQYEVNGIEYENTSDIQQDPGFAIGSTVEVLYDPDDPQKAVINSFIQKGTIFRVLGKIFTSIGLILLVIAFYIILF